MSRPASPGIITNCILRTPTITGYRCLDLQKREASPLVLKAVAPAAKSGPPADIAGPRAVYHEGLRSLLKPGMPGELRITLSLPPQHHLLEGFQSQYLIKTGSNQVIAVAENKRTGTIEHPQVAVPFTAGISGSDRIEVQAVYGYCNDRDKLCIPRDVVWKMEVTVDEKEGVPVVELVDKP